MSKLLDSCPQDPRDAAIYLKAASEALDFAFTNDLATARREYDLLTRVYLRLKQKQIQQGEHHEQTQTTSGRR